VSAAPLVRRLAAVGVAITSARTGALTWLFQHLPPVVLADLTGMHVATAVRWRSTVAASNARNAGLLLESEEGPAGDVRGFPPSLTTRPQRT
jgi:hypothetical protein